MHINAIVFVHTTDVGSVFNPYFPRAVKQAVLSSATVWPLKYNVVCLVTGKGMVREVAPDKTEMATCHIGIYFCKAAK